MYNPYLTQSWADRVQQPHPAPKEESGKDGAGRSGLLKYLKLEELDAGDVLLLLILLFLFLDDREENLELLITLGLMLIL